MKSFFPLFILIIVCNDTFSQNLDTIGYYKSDDSIKVYDKSRFEIGIGAYPNLRDIYYRYRAIHVYGLTVTPFPYETPLIGLGIGAYIKFNISDKIRLTTSLNYSLKGYASAGNVILRDFSTPNGVVFQPASAAAIINVNHNFEYLEIPVLAGLRVFDKSNMNSYLVGGLALNFLLSDFRRAHVKSTALYMGEVTSSEIEDAENADPLNYDYRQQDISLLLGWDFSFGIGSALVGTIRPMATLAVMNLNDRDIESIGYRPSERYLYTIGIDFQLGYLIK